MVAQKILNWDRVESLDLSAMPQPQIKYPGLAERLEGVRGDILLLIGITALFLGLSAWQALRYPVR